MRLSLRLFALVISCSAAAAPLRAQGQPAGTLYIANLGPLPGAAASSASGTATIQLSADNATANVDVVFSNLSSEEVTAHLKVGGVGNSGTFVFALSSGQVTDKSWTFTPTGTFSSSAQLAALTSGNLYVEIDTTGFPGGELGGQFLKGNGAQTFTPPAAPPAVNLSVITQSDAARFLTQATFGATLSDISALIGQGYVPWVSTQMAIPATSHLAATRADATAFPNTGSFAIVQNNREAAWWKVSVTAPDQLRQRVAFALSEIFVTSQVASSLTNQPEAMANYYDLLANDAFGNFRQLLQDVTLSPVMGNYLNMLRNLPANAAKGTSADENYAREVMQLLTIGLDKLNPDGSLQLDATGQPIPTYTQATIIQTANALTGWAYHSTAANPSFTGSTADWYNPMQLYPAFHDNTQKTIVNGVVLPANEGGAADLKAVLDTLFNHPNTGPFICRELIQRLVSSNPSRGYLYRVSQIFANDGTGTRGNLAAVVRAILLDQEARSSSLLSNASFGKLKEPLLRQAAVYRAFNVTAQNGRFGIFNTDTALGQTSLGSPTIFNFFLPNFVQPGSLASAGLYAPEFQITTAAAALTVANNLYSSIYTAAAPAATTLVLDLTPLTSQATNSAALVNTLNLLFCGGNLPTTAQQTILSGLAALPSSTAALDRARFALDLVVTSPGGAVQE